MKPSQFNVVTSYGSTGELLVFNTASGALAAVPPEDVGEATQALEHGATECASESIVQALLEQGFLVDDNWDELSPVLTRIGLGIRDTNRLDVFVLPNMNCNFACPYCFESHFKSQMSDEVEARLLAWFATMVPKFKVVLLSWFGGEPMMSYPQMIRMQAAVKELCEQSGTAFTAHITTNGYQLTSERAAALCEAGLLSYQITMDGPPDIHNNSRVLKGRGDSYGTVFENLCTLALEQPQASIKLRVNFDTETLARVPELLEAFPAEVRARLNLVLEPIFGQAILIGKNPVDVARETEETYDLARRMGFAVTSAPLGPESLTYCYADRTNQFLFTHTGDVFKCTVSEFKKEDRLGWLTEAGAVAWEGPGYDAWMDVPAVDDECTRCSFMPMCLGGCRKNRAESGHASADCTLPFQALDLRIQQKYAVEIQDTTLAAGRRPLLPIVS